MANVFSSGEWIEEFQLALLTSADYQKVAADWEGAFYFVITPDRYFDEEVIYYVDLWHGKCREACLVKHPSQFSPAFRLEATDANWKAVIEGKLDPIRGMMTRKIGVKGDMAKIMRYVKAAQELVKCATSVPTEFPPAKY